MKMSFKPKKTAKKQEEQAEVVETKKEQEQEQVVNIDTKDIHLKQVVTRHGLFYNDEEIPVEVAFAQLRAEFQSLKKIVFDALEEEK